VQKNINFGAKFVNTSLKPLMRIKNLLIFVLFGCSIWANEEPLQVTAYWNGQVFQTCEASQIPANEPCLDELTIYFAAPHIACYGHALLDGSFHLYSILKKYNLLEKPINLLIHVNSDILKNPTFQNILIFLKEVFCFNKIIFLNTDNKSQQLFFKRLMVNDYVPFADAPFKFFSFYEALPESQEYLQILKQFGMRDNIVYQDKEVGLNLLKEYVDFICKAYQIDLPMIKNRLLITYRPTSRTIINIKMLEQSLKKEGYNVVILDFEKIPIKQQIIETVQSEYLLGTYGSNLTNAIFLKPEAHVVILWHKYAKYYWSRKYCIIHSAFLSKGVKLVEYDKPNYDDRDVYTNQVYFSDYFYKRWGKIFLRPEKANMEALTSYPVSMYEITNVNLYIDPQDLIKTMKNANKL
jgi:hypothetical protein